MQSVDQLKKQSFDKEWQARLEKSPYTFKEIWLFSNRQIALGTRVTLKQEENNEIIEAKVIKKPYYMDRFGKARYRGFIVCELDNGERFVAHVDHVYKK